MLGMRKDLKWRCFPNLVTSGNIAYVLVWPDPNHIPLSLLSGRKEAWSGVLSSYPEIVAMFAVVYLKSVDRLCCLQLKSLLTVYQNASFAPTSLLLCTHTCTYIQGMHNYVHMSIHCVSILLHVHTMYHDMQLVLMQWTHVFSYYLYMWFIDACLCSLERSTSLVANCKHDIIHKYKASFCPAPALELLCT